MAWDGISNEMLTHSSPKLRFTILTLFNLLFKSEQFPEIWKENVITPIFKQGEKYDPNNYRGIRVSSNLGKLFCSIINDKFIQFIQEHKILNNCQIGFMPRRRTSNYIYTLSILIQKYVHQSKQGQFFGCFIDLKKSLWLSMAPWTFTKTNSKRNRRGDKWHHKGHIQWEQMLCQNQWKTDWLFPVKTAASARLFLISILTNWHQHLISPLVLVWPSRAEKSNASCMQTIFCCCRLMKRGCTKVSQLEKITVQTGPYH